MNRRIRRICLSLIFPFLMAGCTGVPGASPSPTVSPGDTTPGAPPGEAPSQEIAGLLPHEEGFQWHYMGFEEYGHEMTLNAVTPGTDRITYTVSGQVYDLSDGESGNDFSIALTYTVDAQSLIQEKTAPMMMDSYDRLLLIRTPLEEGADWQQTVRDTAGQDVTLSCTIEKVEEKPAGAVYTVLYQDTASEYYERREIQEDNGVIRFEKLYMPQGEESFPIGYSMYTNAEDVNGALAPYLPVLERDLYYSGLAEFGFVGKLKLESENEREAVYTFDGIFQDGSGIDALFQVQYHVDYERGTVTEQVVSNEKTGEKEINSKLHDAVICKLPIEEGAAWDEETTVNGKPYPYHAEITEFDADTGFIRIRYTVQGVPGYHNETYIEERTFEYSYGMTSFQNIMPGEITVGEGETERPRSRRLRAICSATRSIKSNEARLIEKGARPCPLGLFHHTELQGVTGPAARWTDLLISLRALFPSYRP